MKKLRAKMKKIRTTEWRKLSRGEKIAAVLMSLLKGAVMVAVIVAAVLAIAGIAFAVFMGFVIASCIANALSGGFNYIGYDETYVRFRK